MEKNTVMVAMLFVTGILTAALGESIVTLKSGEVLRGDILSDTNDVLQIRVYSANRSISSRRDVPRSDVQNIQNETPAEAAERVAYFALSKFQLNADQEQTTDFYAQWIAAFEKFLTDYPKSDKTVIIQQRIEACQAELKHVADGEVKFADKWMSPVEKRPLLLKKQLADLQRQRDSLAVAIGEARGRLAGLQAKLGTLRDTQNPVDNTRTVPDPRRRGAYVVEHYTTYPVVPNPERPKVQADIVRCQQQIGAGEPVLASLDARTRSIEIEIPQAQQALEVARASDNQKSAQVESQPAPPPPPPTAEPIGTPPVVVTPEPWIVRNWKGLAISGGILVILLALARPLLKRRAAQVQAAQAMHDEQCRAAYEQLKSIFDRIFIEGERPAGKNIPEGEIVPVGRGKDAHGGGRWFVIGPDHIWAVQNNGRENDNWVYNNVITDGPGAIGARIPAESEFADSIKTLATAAG